MASDAQGPLVVFYSWQSDHEQPRIEEALKIAAERLKEEGLDVKVVAAMEWVWGSPDIAGTVLARIRDADGFVGDVSLAYTSDAKAPRRAPNPNVMAESALRQSIPDSVAVVLLGSRSARSKRLRGVAERYACLP